MAPSAPFFRPFPFCRLLMPGGITEQKTALRRVMRERRAALEPNMRAAAAFVVRDRLIEMLPRLALPAGAVVAGFLPIRDEIDPRPALEALRERGFRLVLPVVIARNEPLIFREWLPGTVLEPDAFHIPAPPVWAEQLAPDLLLVPMLAFDRKGERLGYGAGFYDVTLTLLRAQRASIAVGIAFSTQEVEAVPVSARDVMLDALVTEIDVLWFGRFAGGGAAPS
ncbi:MAG TPA: 5-formyltetrahydrofolate cyclo-ligase [Stellaceae bacterium]|nr:5-formyltetrahydrofolate cyclo-ligase [Stellaceae bacterium]